MGSTFKSNDTPVSEILRSIEKGIIQLPDFQRGWVWDDNRIKALIASISNSYPVGALMFLEYNEGGNVRFKYRPFTGATALHNPEVLVLDGQQRMTSIFNALFSRQAVLTRTDKNKEIKRFYYLDIERCLNSTTDRVDAIISVPEDKIVRSNFGRDIELDLSTRENECKNNMFPLNIVYDPIEAQMWMNDYQKYYNYDPIILAKYAQFFADILVPIQSYKVPVITLSKDTPKEAVCQVFENVNTGGVSLTVFELITATFAADNFELRKDWEKRYKKLIEKSALSVSNQKEAILSVVSSTDFLTAITLLHRYYVKINGGEAISCKKKDVLKLSLSEYQQYSDVLTEGFIQAASFLKEQRIFSARDLPYSTQLIPLAVIFSILKTRTQDSTIKEKISTWYWCGVFGEMYGGANETRYANDVGGMIDWINGGNEPDTVQRAYFQPTRLLSLQTRLSAAYKGVMALILKEGCLDFISGSAMDFTVYLDENTDIHHIFPRAYCEAKQFNKTKWNSIVNKTPLFARTNRIIGGNAPSDYLMKIEKSNHVERTNLEYYIKTHKIDVIDLRNDNFDEFFIKRAKSLLGLISEAMSKSIPNLNGEDIIAGFGGPLE
ncbi:GmrSD restriction endonuclease domain-containing protein [Peribacillus frigoritolerans]|uniref:GmrSD restriction endonuclease domain-containing protein n=1 Tax=Peribacillus frigoritolerans TaxID=450367 RepID=UPI00215AF5E4|nr:DUF262 domain-containing protein [Peribacillus frigoritolerans]MCR8870681.1 DUF262 domain-containing protein [Peribacillus frigoritolerans]MCY8935650.1 DUF262 domain-containing protein [Peribacillus frigoritolerans]